MPKLKHRRQLRKGKRNMRHRTKAKRWARGVLWARSGGCCEYCGDPLTLQETCGSVLGDGTSEPATLDHVIPRSLGGADDIGNLRLACRECNQNKAAMTLREWLEADEEDVGDE